MLPLAEYRDRQERLRAAMVERGIDAVYLSFTPNLDYVAGLADPAAGRHRDPPPGDWLTGAFYTQNDELIVLAPRMDQKWVVPAVEAVPWVSGAADLRGSGGPGAGLQGDRDRSSA